MIDIIPGILEQDEKTLEHKLSLVVSSVPCVQIDIADETLVSVKSASDFLALKRMIKPYVENGLVFEAHLMAKKPEIFLPALADAGFLRVIAHVECDDPREFVADARTHEMTVGLALDLESGVEVIEPFLEEIDFVLIMTTETGMRGQIFQPEVVEKIRTIHRNFPDLPIIVEGGMTPKTAKIVSDAGATGIIVTTYLFDGEQSFADAYASFSSE
jgi:ribulose-phosphate 3-epimerase